MYGGIAATISLKQILEMKTTCFDPWIDLWCRALSHRSSCWIHLQPLVSLICSRGPQKYSQKKHPKKIAQMIDVPVGKSAKSPYISKPWVLDGPHQITHHPQRNTQKPGDHGSRSQWQEGTHGIVCSCFGTQFWKLLVYKNPFLLPMFIFDLSCMVIWYPGGPVLINHQYPPHKIHCSMKGYQLSWFLQIF